MNDRDRAELRRRAELQRVKKLIDKAGGEPHAHQQLEEAVRGVEPAMAARAEHDLAAEEMVEKVRSIMTQVAEAYSEHLQRMVAQLAQQVVAAYSAQVTGMLSRLAREAFSVYEAQIAEMSRQIVEAVNAQMASVRLPRVEVFRPTLDPLIAQIPYHPRPAPAPQPSAPARKQDSLNQDAKDVAKAVVATLLVEAFLWHAQTGLWVFEQLLIYLLQQLD
jgi:hypothetical protein